MTTKSLLRLLIGCAIAACLIIGILPSVGLPRAQILPPPMIYGQATGKTYGYVTKKKVEDSPNPFESGVKVFRVDYRFRATVPPNLGAKKVGKQEVYTGRAYVERGLYDGLQVGAQVPVKFEKTYPVINGINVKGGERSTEQGSGLLSGWILYAIAIVVLGYCIAPLLERVMLRENF